MRYILLLLLCTLPVLGQEFQTKVFVLNARPAAATVEMVRPLLSPGGRVIPETRLNKLVVRDTPQVLSEVEALLKEIDVHLPQVSINVNLNGVASTQGTQVGGVVAGDNRRVGVAGTAVAGGTNSAVSSQQKLVVLSGERGVIYAGRNILNGNPFQQFAVAQGLLPPDFLFQSVDSGFAVEPIVVGDVVRLRITPWLSFISPQGAQQVRVEQASTNVSLRSGQSMSISSGGYSQEIKNRAFGLIFGAGSQSVSGGQNMTVQVSIMDY